LTKWSIHTWERAMPGQKGSEALRRQQILEAAHKVALRQGIAGLTLRAVAAQANLSHGLVLFHFKRKAQLVSAVLDQVLAAALSIDVTEEVARTEEPLHRLRTLLRREVDRLSRNPQQVRLFLEYWALGIRSGAIRRKISAELERYRAAFRAVTEDVLPAEVARFPGVTPEGLAAIAVSFINGCAVQAMIDPDRFDTEEYLAAVHGILGQVPVAA
jgi:TetR/AcrR family transcriptional repressor of bet genes